MVELDGKALLLDLETSPDGGRVLSLGAVAGGRETRLAGGRQLGESLRRLESLALAAEVVVGHNLLEHDLGVLMKLGGAEYAPRLLSMPVVDTLYLSPVCFPENPYHKLVKEYKLVSQSRNDPVADARLCGHLLDDEIDSLRGTAAAAPEVFACLRFLVAGPPAGAAADKRLARGMEWVFVRAAQAAAQAAAQTAHPPEFSDAAVGSGAVRHLLGGLACQAAANALDDADFAGHEARWALAFAIAWLRVAGTDSVLPRWTRERNRMLQPLLSRLRDIPCGAADCAYCAEYHHPERQLQRFFGFDGFRETPADERGGSLQRQITLAGMRQESLLAIMPTGGGKSLCFQLPALVRALRRGQLTIVVSPLQALMKDQVDGLARRTGAHNADALSGLLTMPERHATLRAVASGAVSLLYITPEQLRGRAVRGALLSREIGCWVMDEAHCLSKWGHDFRPDYLYVGRFIRETAKSQGCAVPPVACFTATAKNEVVGEIIEYFRRETNIELRLFQGGVERGNLRFEVATVSSHGKLECVRELLGERLPPDAEGSAVVFRATRQAAEETAALLKSRGWAAEFFHAGLPIMEKKDIQDRFLAGDVRVICATNAFGMGIDKDDVRLVVHGDIPGSLENYLQEAGRAGRDLRDADCVLLYDEEDIEQQFRLGAMSELSRRDIANILRVLRKAAARDSRDSEVVITAGEILRDEDADTDIDTRERLADTKVRVAVSWLEQAGYIERGDNFNRVIQARLLVRDVEEARAKIAPLNLSQLETGLWLAIVGEIANASETDMLSVDGIADLPEFQEYWRNSPNGEAGRGGRRGPEYLGIKILKIIDAMAECRVLKKDTLLTAYLRHKIADHSQARLKGVAAVEREMLKLLVEREPDPEGWLSLDLRPLNDELLRGGAESSVELLRRGIASLAEDGRGFAGNVGSLDVRHVGGTSYRVRLPRGWPITLELAERRRAVAALILDTLSASIPAEAPPRADLLVSFSFEQLQAAIGSDMVLRSEVRDIHAAIERGLMYMHEQKVIVLQRGLAIFRSAMTIRVPPETARRRYTAENYQTLKHHYNERTFQVHVMNEYARYGLRGIRGALNLVAAYFSMDKESFIKRFLPDKKRVLEMATTEESHRRIVESLGNREQTHIVTRPEHRNLLVLAGPGSGKTKTVVHRCAYLLRVKRVRPRSILVCCFNHAAALELRSRLRALVGADSRGVAVQTYHGLAMRILGRSFRGVGESVETGEPDFDSVVADAVAVLKGDKPVPGVEPDEIRERLLAGFEHILVDEYQDIDGTQYEMIAAIAGRTSREPERKLAILAVGDDDQAIYGFRGANVEFIRRFQADYQAETVHLVENYRSTANIIEAANRVISRNRCRMKEGHPITIDHRRQSDPPGGDFAIRDPLNGGRVGFVNAPGDANLAAAVVDEARRLRGLGLEWRDMAVLTRTRRDLALVRAAAESAGVPVSWSFERGKAPPLARVREIAALLRQLELERGEFYRAAEIRGRYTALLEGENPWKSLARRLLEAWEDETDDTRAPVDSCVEFLYEGLSRQRHDLRFGDGLFLSTIHAAKGMEFPHVLLCADCPRIPRGGAEIEEERRLLYVGMTRSRESLTVFSRGNRATPFVDELVGPCFAPRDAAAPTAGLAVGEAAQYEILGLEDFLIDFAGWHPEDGAIHRALAALEFGAPLELRERGGAMQVFDPHGFPLARLSATATAKWRPRLAEIGQIRVVCMLERRRADQRSAEFAAKLRAERWEIPICELRLENATANTKI